MKRVVKKYTEEEKRTLIERIDTLRASGKSLQDAAQEAGTHQSNYFAWVKNKAAKRPYKKRSANLPALVSKSIALPKRGVIDLEQIPLTREPEPDITVMVFNGNPTSVATAISKLRNNGGSY